MPISSNKSLSRKQTTFENKQTSKNDLPIVPGKQTYRNAAIQKTKFPAKTFILSDKV